MFKGKHTAATKELCRIAAKKQQERLAWERSQRAQRQGKPSPSPLKPGVWTRAKQLVGLSKSESQDAGSVVSLHVSAIPCESTPVAQQPRPVVHAPAPSRDPSNPVIAYPDLWRARDQADFHVRSDGSPCGGSGDESSIFALARQIADGSRWFNERGGRHCTYSCRL